MWEHTEDNQFVFKYASISSTYPCHSVRKFEAPSHFKISIPPASVVALREKLKKSDPNYLSILGLGGVGGGGRKNKSLSIQIFWARTFLTQSLPGPNFFKWSVPGGLHIFRAYYQKPYQSRDNDLSNMTLPLFLNVKVVKKSSLLYIYPSHHHRVKAKIRF